MGAKAEKGFKFVKMSLENYWRKEIQKKGEGVGAWPSSAAWPSSPAPLPRADASASLHPALATWRPYAQPRGVVDTVGTPPRASRRPLCPLPAPSPSPLASAAAAATAAAPLLAQLRHSPPAMSVSHCPRQGQRRVRLRRGKPLRTLYRGESHQRARNHPSEFTRPRRSAPPRRNPPVSASFRLFLSVLGSGRGEEAQTIPRTRSTPPEWSSHGEQRRRAAMQASRGAPAVLQPNQGYPWVRLAVLTPWPETSPPTRSARRRCSPSRSH